MRKGVVHFGCPNTRNDFISNFNLWVAGEEMRVMGRWAGEIHFYFIFFRFIVFFIYLTAKRYNNGGGYILILLYATGYYLVPIYII